MHANTLQTSLGLGALRTRLDPGRCHSRAQTAPVYSPVLHAKLAVSGLLPARHKHVRVLLAHPTDVCVQH